jgi:hypothetical protein
MRSSRSDGSISPRSSRSNPLPDVVEKRAQLLLVVPTDQGACRPAPRLLAFNIPDPDAVAHVRNLPRLGSVHRRGGLRAVARRVRFRREASKEPRHGRDRCRRHAARREESRVASPFPAEGHLPAVGQGGWSRSARRTIVWLVTRRNLGLSRRRSSSWVSGPVSSSRLWALMMSAWDESSWLTGRRGGRSRGLEPRSLGKCCGLPDRDEYRNPGNEQTGVRLSLRWMSADPARRRPGR